MSIILRYRPYHYVLQIFDSYQAYVRREVEHISNGDSQITVRLMFHKDSFEKNELWQLKEASKLNYKEFQSMSDEEKLNQFYSSKYFEVVFKKLRKAFAKIDQKYHGFPSALHKTKIINVLFLNEESLGGGSFAASHGENEEDEDNFDVVNLFISIENLDVLKLWVIKHELYHIISRFHHAELKQIKRLSKIESTLHESVKQNMDKIDNWLETIEKDFKTDLAMNLSLDRFYQDEGLRIYWNMIGDTALNIIVMELGDQHYIREIMKYHKGITKEKYKEFVTLHDMVKKIKSDNGLDIKKRKFYLSFLHLMQFIKGYTTFPYNLVPYALIKDYWNPKPLYSKIVRWKDYRHKAKKQINTFEGYVRKYFESKPSEAILTFWGYFESIVKSMNIFVDPLHPDVPKEIHNVQTMRSARKGYNLLTRLFVSLIDEVKKYEN